MQIEPRKMPTLSYTWKHFGNQKEAEEQARIVLSNTPYDWFIHRQVSKEGLEQFFPIIHLTDSQTADARSLYYTTGFCPFHSAR